MELQLILASGFLFLGGIVLTFTFLYPLGITLAFLGLIPLIVFYFRSFKQWLDLHFPDPAKQKNKEDSNGKT